MEDDSNLKETDDRGSWLRSGSVFIRAAHLLAASAVGGACLLDVEAAGTHAWWIVVGASGVLLLVVELVRHRELHRELAQYTIALKEVLHELFDQVVGFGVSA